MATIAAPAPTSRTISTPAKLLVNNKWIDSESGKTFPTFNPATGAELAQIAEADAALTKLSPRPAKPSKTARGTGLPPPSADA